MVVIYGYLERDNDKVFKFHLRNSSFFKQVFSSFKRRPLKLYLFIIIIIIIFIIIIIIIHLFKVDLSKSFTIKSIYIALESTMFRRID